MRHYVTFSGARYDYTTQRIVEDAPKYGVDNVIVYDDFWLRECRPEYWSRVEWFRNQRHKDEAGPRGVDWFIFKSYVMLDALRRIEPGDVFLFTDSDTFPVTNLGYLYDTCVADGGVMLFGARGCLIREWTKRDVMLLMGCDGPKYLDEWQTVGRFMLYRKPTGTGVEFDSERFLLDWLAYTANPFVNTFEPSVLGPDQPELRQSRAEQSVLSNLRIRYGLPIYREACEFGCWEGKADLAHERDLPHQFFSQDGRHSYRTGYAGDESEGSAFRSVHD